MNFLFTISLLSISCETYDHDLGLTILTDFITAIQEKNFTKLSRIISANYKTVHLDNSSTFVSREEIFDYIKLIPGKITNDDVHVLEVDEKDNGNLKILAKISDLGECRFKVRKKKTGTGYEIHTEVQKRAKIIPKYSIFINDTLLAWNVANEMNRKYVDAVRLQNLTLLGEVLLNPHPIQFVTAQRETREEKVYHKTMLKEYLPVNKIVPVDYLIITGAERYDNGTVIFEAFQNRLHSLFTAAPVENGYKIVMERQLNVAKNNRPTLDGLYSMDGQK